MWPDGYEQFWAAYICIYTYASGKAKFRGRMVSGFRNADDGTRILMSRSSTSGKLDKPFLGSRSSAAFNSLLLLELLLLLLLLRRRRRLLLLTVTITITFAILTQSRTGPFSFSKPEKVHPWSIWVVLKSRVTFRFPKIVRHPCKKGNTKRRRFRKLPVSTISAGSRWKGAAK